MKVLKVGGKRVPFDVDKVRSSILRTGASKEIVESVVAEVEKRVRDGMTTKEVYAIVFDVLSEKDHGIALKYNLRSAILKLGPAGFHFEKYVVAILRAHNYEAYVPDEDLQGACVKHEVDGIAEKDGRRMMIEAKFRNRYEDNIDLKDVMSTWARFLDLVDSAAVGNAPHFDEVWVVTNAKFSESARQYGVCKGMRLIGWNFPPERSFARLVDIQSLYPVTVLEGIAPNELQAFADQRMLLCKDIAKNEPDELHEKLGVSVKRGEEILRKCDEVIGG